MDGWMEDERYSCLTDGMFIEFIWPDSASGGKDTSMQGRKCAIVHATDARQARIFIPRQGRQGKHQRPGQFHPWL